MNPNLAQAVNAPTDLQSLLDIVRQIVASLFPILIGIALLVFIWGLVKFIYSSGDVKTHAEGRRFMIWGIVILFVMMAFMGLVDFFYQDFGFNNSHPLGLPTLCTNCSTSNK